ncbi:MAG: DUF2336 domain-containing protein [Rhodothalassiaceae bacterium]
MSRRSSSLRKDPRYIANRAALEAGDLARRRAMARGEDTHPEILYYLAEDGDSMVRRAVAGNSATPRQADQLLTGDPDDEVRIELARKIARLVPGLSSEENRRLRERTLAILETLANDTLPKVRAIVAEEIKRSDAVPKALVRKLAQDVEDTVCCPVLEYSPLLNDDDLREIIAAGISQGALVAIARRDGVGEAVSDDIAATLEVPAVAALLANPSPQIREDTLDRIIEQARDTMELHKPLALRPALSIRAMKRIASFVASALVHKMLERNAIEEDAAEEILDRVRERIASERVGNDEEKRLAAQARKFHDRGMLDDAFVTDAIDNNRRELLIQCLAIMAQIPAQAVRDILASKSGRAVTALAWAAGLSMRTAFKMQTEIALVSPSQLVPARDGIDYPMEESELVWQLSYFTD